MFEKLIDLAVEKWRSTFFIIFLLFVFGIVGYINIPKESSPEIAIPYIQVSVNYKGLSPEDGERIIIKPLENQLKSISGIKKVQCEARFGFASCGAEFLAGTVTVQKALTDVRDAVNIAKKDFPKEADEPIVAEFDIKKDQPVLTISISGEFSDDVMFKIADDLKEQIKGLKEVLDVTVYGQRDHSVEIIIKPETINQYKLNINDFANIHSQNNVLVGGRVRNGDGEFVLHVPGLIQNVQDLLEMPIKANNGTVLALKDVATVKKTYKEAASISRFNGKKTITLNIAKRTGENIIFTVEKIKAVVGAYSQFLPKDIKITFMNDSSHEIKESLTNLNNNLILAVIIVFFVVLNLIGFKESLLIMTTIPLSFLMGIMFLYFGGYTMNVVVLFALVLGTGMIVDASIVIIEYAELLLKDGISPTEAFKRAAKRMFIPVFSSVVTVIIVSAPLLFWPGVPGQFMKYLPLTLIALLASSFVAAIIFLPTLATRFVKKYEHKGGNEMLNYTNLTNAPISSLLKLNGLIGAYVRVVWGLLSKPKLTLLGLFATLVVIGLFYAKFNKGTELFPTSETDFARVRVKVGGNLSLPEKDKIIREVEEIISKIPDVKYYQALTYSSSTNDIGRINLEFKPWNERRKAIEILNEIKEKTANIPGVEIKTAAQKGGPGGSSDITLNILGKETEDIEKTLQRVKSFMQKDGGFIDIDDDLSSKKIQYSIKVNRAQASKYGIDINAVGNFVSLATDGLIISNYRPSYSDDKVDIILRFSKDARTIEDIKSLRVPAINGGFVPLASFAAIKMEREVGIINRLNQKKVVVLSANVKKDFVTSVKVQELFKWIAENAGTFEAQIQLGGDAEEMQEVISFLLGAFGTAIIIMVLLFLMQFNSVGKTIIVINSIFLSIFGVFIALMLTGQPFSVVMSGVAIMALSGMVVDSNILFIETFKDFEKKLEIKEALLKTAILRVKPILLASITTVAGMVPMIFGLSINFIDRDLTIGAPSSEIWKQLAAGIAGGLTFVTMLTLFITPCILFLEETFKIKLKDGKFFRKKP